MRPGLVAGLNVDRVDVRAGMKKAQSLGFTDGKDLMVIEYALLRWKRGEEEGAVRTFLSHFKNELTCWHMIIAAAIAAAEAAAKRTRYTFSHRADGRYYWEARIPGDSRVEQVSCSVDYFWNNRPDSKKG